MAKENPGWGYDRIVGAMANLGHRLSDQTVGNILRRHDIPPAPKRKQTTSWKDFIRAHMAVLVATDFFTVEVLTLKGLITYYVLFFIHLESRRICLAGVTRHPDQEWMEQMARNVTMEDSGFLIHRRYLLHDHDSKYSSSFRQVIEAGSVKTLALPPRSPNLNAYAERWVRSVREECLAKLILLGEGSLRRALRHYEAHYHEERNHQGKNNVLLFPLPTQGVRGEQEKVRCRERLGGLLKYYEREAAWAANKNIRFRPWGSGCLASFCGAGSFETYGGGILVVMEGDAAIPGVSGPQRGVSLAGFLCFCWLKQEEDEEELTTVQKHSREGYNLAALLFLDRKSTR